MIMSKLVVNLNYQLVKKELAFMITKTLFMSCYYSICDPSLVDVKTQYKALYYCFDKQFTFTK